MLERKTETDGPDGSDVSYKIPTHPDFMIAYSTIPGMMMKGFVWDLLENFCSEAFSFRARYY